MSYIRHTPNSIKNNVSIEKIWSDFMARKSICKFLTKNNKLTNKIGADLEVQFYEYFRQFSYSLYIKHSFSVLIELIKLSFELDTTKNLLFNMIFTFPSKLFKRTIFQKMISVVIRNKNEANYLKDTLSVLRTNYGSEISEIILVDNLSSDNSIAVAESFNCIVITIKEFTYGKALNLGIKNAANEYILLLSAHVLPVGSFFFKTALDEFSKNKNLAGIRFINSYDNYIRALQNDCEIEDGFKLRSNECLLNDKKECLGKI